MPFTLIPQNSISGGVGDSLRPNAKPLIINGDMAVAQRGTSKTSITGGGYYTIDRFDVNNAGAFIGTWTQTQESLSSGDPFADGFAKSLKMDCTTANGSPAANSQCRLDCKFEGLNVQSLKHGTANAEKTTLSFWIKATKTGTNVVRMYKPDADRSCSIAYTVSSSNTWEKKILNFPADTSGTVIANDNTMGLQMTFGIAMGSNNTSGTLQTTWGANTQANDYVGQVNNADSTSNNWEITGVQLEVGEYTSSTLPPFQHESYGENLSRCQRYFQLVSTMSGGTSNTTTAYVNPKLFTTLRAAASYSVEGALSMQDSETNLTQSSGHVTLHNGNETGAFLELQNFSGATDNRPFLTRFLNNNKLKVDAEL